MLISHVHRFIYLKTLKTAGTSVEIYFERYCTDPGRDFQELHHREMEVSKWGVIGARGQLYVPGRAWWNHMPAGRVLALIGPELWSQYYKFCVVRNPFDKMVSSFWHGLPAADLLRLQHAGFETVRSRFHDWLRTARHPMDREIFTIGSQPVMNRFVRYEDLHSGLAGVCKDLGLPWDASQLGRYKAGTRVRDEPFVQYYDRVATDLVHELFRWELEYFEYAEP